MRAVSKLVSTRSPGTKHSVEPCVAKSGGAARKSAYATLVQNCLRDPADCKPVSVPHLAVRWQSFIWAGHCCPALATYPEVERSGPLLLPYLVLLRMGFALPVALLRPRCALTAPFHPYLRCRRRYVFCGTFRETRFERVPPAVSRHAALWRPDFPPGATEAITPSDCPSARSLPPLSQALVTPEFHTSEEKRPSIRQRKASIHGDGWCILGWVDCVVPQNIAMNSPAESGFLRWR